MAPRYLDGLSLVDLYDDRYTVEQAVVRSKYAVYDSRDRLVLETGARGNWSGSTTTSFPFRNADGEVVFRVEQTSTYSRWTWRLVDPATDEAVVELERETGFVHEWDIRGTLIGRTLVTVEGRGLRTWLASLVPFGLVPHRYDIVSRNDEKLGRIEGRSSLRDSYEIRIVDSGEVPKETLVAAVVVIDAIEGN